MRALEGKRILITRTRRQASELAAQLEALGGIPIVIPTIEIIPPESYVSLDAALAQLNSFDWLIFTSANAVEVFNDRIDRVPHLRDGFIVAKVGNRAEHDPLSSVQSRISPEAKPAKLPRIAVIGPATARAVEGIGLPVDLIPPTYVAESLAESVTPEAHGKSILLIRAAEARDILPEALTRAGATVTIAEAYRNRIPPESIPALQQIFASPATWPDAITFTSASTARNLVTLLEAANLTLPPAIALASIGPITSQALRELGLTATVESGEPTIPALVQTLADFFTNAN
ncbi:MAG TPA: uroporphyrinogen-III synthase [Edaphobacter sp.]